MATRTLRPYDKDDDQFIDADFIIGSIKQLADGSLVDTDTDTTIYDGENDEIPRRVVAAPPLSEVLDYAFDKVERVATEADITLQRDPDHAAFLTDDQRIVNGDGNGNWQTIANVGSGSGHSISDDGTEISSSFSDLDATTGLNVSDDGDGTVTANVEREQIEDWVSSLLSAGDKLSLTYDDAGDTLTVDTSALDTEEVEDAVASLITGGSNISVSYDDPNDTLTISLANSVSVDDISVTNGFVWQEDPNSPVSFGNSITLANEYNTVMLMIDDTPGGFNNTVAVRVNGDSGSNYTYLDNSDSQTTGATEIPIGSDRETAGHSIWLGGKWSSYFTLSQQVPGHVTGRTVGARNTNVSSPLDSISLINPNSNSIAGKAYVYGWSA